ncbi:hypothetical protein LZ31DRAFT_554686 [Colletotrichum somersetense]|nr:hypothetical protein LZ31DRAFT_554686 [Colletotrichum somersetense]
MRPAFSLCLYIAKSSPHRPVVVIVVSGIYTCSQWRGERQGSTSCLPLTAAGAPKGSKDVPDAMYGCTPSIRARMTTTTTTTVTVCEMWIHPSRPFPPMPTDIHTDKNAHAHQDDQRLGATRQDR